MVTVAPGGKSKFWCILPLRAKSSFRLAVSCCYRQNRRKWHVGKRNFVQGYRRTFENFNGTQVISIFYNGTQVKGSFVLFSRPHASAVEICLSTNFPVCNLNNRQGKQTNRQDNVNFFGSYWKPDRVINYPVGFLNSQVNENFP